MIGIVVGAAPVLSERIILKKLIEENPRENIYIIAADGGIQVFLEESIAPDLWIGDMDSSGEFSKAELIDKWPCGLERRTCSPIKNETDMELALNIFREKSISKIYMFGGIGGNRISHLYANTQLMMDAKSKGMEVIAFGEGITMQVLKGPETLHFDKEHTGFVSVIALTDKAQGLKIQGLFYEYQGDLTNSHALGVSNEFCGKEAFISIEKGCLLVIQEKAG